MKSSPFLTATDITQNELALIITLLEQHLDEGVIDEEIELYSSDEVGKLWIRLATVESCAEAASKEENNEQKEQTKTT